MGKKFSIKDFGDKLIDYTLKRANRAINDYEYQIMLSMSEVASSVENQRRQMDSWQNRTWNLVSSFYIVLLYDGKIVGVQTEGAVINTPKGRKSPKTRSGFRAAKLNPSFSYTYTRKGTNEWRGDDKEHYPFWNARVYANYAIQKTIARNRKKGYVIIYGFGMPYSTSPKPYKLPMRERTARVLSALADLLVSNMPVLKGVTYKRIDGAFKIWR